MDSNILFSSSIYREQETREDEELLVFTRAMADVISPQQARLAERDWLDEADSMDTPPLSTNRNWRTVSIAASFRLAAEPDALAHLLSDDDHRKRHDHFSHAAKRR